MRFIERLRQAKVVDLAGYRRVLEAAQRRQALQIVTPADVRGDTLQENPQRNDWPMLPADTEREPA